MRIILHFLLILLIASKTSGQVYEVLTDIPYKDSPSSDKQKLDLYIPNFNDLMPCLVWIHGGAWLSGSKNGVKYKIDSSRIAMAGSSAGGHLASLTGTSSGIPSLEDKISRSDKVSSRVNAVVDFYGPTDFLIMDELPEICQGPMIHLDPNSPESKTLVLNFLNKTLK